MGLCSALWSLQYASSCSEDENCGSGGEAADHWSKLFSSRCLSFSRDGARMLFTSCKVVNPLRRIDLADGNSGIKRFGSRHSLYD